MFIVSIFLNDSLGWKIVGEANGKTPVSLPSNFNELSIVVYRSTSLTSAYAFHILREYIKADYVTFLQGYSHNTGNQLCHVKVSTTQVELSTMQLAGNDVSNDAKISVYYK